MNRIHLANVLPQRFIFLLDLARMELNRIFNHLWSTGVLSVSSVLYVPKALRMLAAIVSAIFFIFTSDSASIITRASASVPE